jgi:putative ABC transport system substrate-binding protein
MKRRRFITLLGGAVVGLPIVARAQQAENPVRIGFLPIGSPSNAYDRSLVEAFRHGLREVGVIAQQAFS